MVGIQEAPELDLAAQAIQVGVTAILILEACAKNPALASTLTRVKITNFGPIPGPWYAGPSSWPATRRGWGATGVGTSEMKTPRWNATRGVLSMGKMVY